jgi:mannose-1-phosphate guanylyltransferase/mannose-6-phosphate isomerase
MTNGHPIIPVILCGGAGKRLWPLSRKNNPKQFFRLNGKKSLLHETVERAVFCTEQDLSTIVTITTQALEHKTRIHLADLSSDLTRHLLTEPDSKNTAPAIMLAAQYIKENFDEETLMWILPSDHTINDNQTLKQSLKKAILLALQNQIVTFGIKPQWPETGYGYIKAQNNSVEIFTEKPDLKTAKKYLQLGDYFWNSGMFLATCSLIIEEIDKHTPDLLKSGQSISFDKAVMEKTDKAVTIKCDLGWSDVGSWRSLWRLKNKKQKLSA